MALELVRPFPNPDRLALVLSGGGVRAMAQIGVIDAMLEYGIVPEVVVGTSGGAIVAALYAAGRTPAEMTEIVMAWSDKSRQLVDFNWLGVAQCILSMSFKPFSGFVRGSRIARVVRQSIAPYQRFQDLRGDKTLPLFVTAVDLNDGQEVVFCDPSWVKVAQDADGTCEGYVICGQEGIVEAVRASYAIPGVFVPAKCSVSKHCGHCSRATEHARPERYVDGGVRDNLPLIPAVRLAGAGRVFAVNLGYAGMRRDDVAAGGLADILGQSLDIMSLDQLDADLNDQVVARAKAVIVNPMIYDVGTFELEYVPYLIDRGRRLALRFFAERGLTKGVPGQENRRRLFAGVATNVSYPAKDSQAYSEFPAQIKKAYPNAGRVSRRRSASPAGTVPISPKR